MFTKFFVSRDDFRRRAKKRRRGRLRSTLVLIWGAASCYTVFEQVSSAKSHLGYTEIFSGFLVILSGSA